MPFSYTEKCIVTQTKVQLLADKLVYEQSTIFGEKAERTFRLDQLSPEPMKITVTGFNGQADSFYFLTLISALIGYLPAFALPRPYSQMFFVFYIIGLIVMVLIIDAQTKVISKTYFFTSGVPAFWIRRRGRDSHRFEIFANKLERAIEKSREADLPPRA